MCHMGSPLTYLLENPLNVYIGNDWARNWGIHCRPAGVEVSILCEQLMCWWGLVKQDCQFAGCVLEGRRNGGLGVWAGTSQLCCLSVSLSSQTYGSAPFISSVLFRARLGWEAPPLCSSEQNEWQTNAVLSLFSFFISAFQEDFLKKKQNKKPRSLSAFKHTLFLYRKKKPKEQHVLVKSLLSPSGLFFGSGFSWLVPTQCTPAGEVGFTTGDSEKICSSRVRIKPHYLWMSGRKHRGTLVPIFPLDWSPPTSRLARLSCPFLPVTPSLKKGFLGRKWGIFFHIIWMGSFGWFS